MGKGIFLRPLSPREGWKKRGRRGYTWFKSIKPLIYIGI